MTSTLQREWCLVKGATGARAQGLAPAPTVAAWAVAVQAVAALAKVGAADGAPSAPDSDLITRLCVAKISVVMSNLSKDKMFYLRQQRHRLMPW